MHHGMPPSDWFHQKAINFQHLLIESALSNSSSRRKHDLLVYQITSGSGWAKPSLSLLVLLLHKRLPGLWPCESSVKHHNFRPRHMLNFWTASSPRCLSTSTSSSIWGGGVVQNAGAGCRVRMWGVISSCHVPLLYLLSFRSGVQNAGAECGCRVRVQGAWYACEV